MKRFTRTAAVMTLTVAVCLSACAAPEPSTGAPGATSPAASALVNDGTFVTSIVTDPGALDPQLSIVSGVFEMSGYAYDSLVSVSASGEVRSQLADSWTYEGTVATFVLHDGITCSDGSELTAKTVADNLNWMLDVENASPILGTFLPAGMTVASDNATKTVTLTLASPAPFLLESISNVPIVCDAGLTDRSKLAAASLGSGPYELTEAVVGDHYTYQRRDGYTWGPGGATTAEPGLPKTISVRILPNESTQVNLLLSGEVNSATTVGPDASRAQAAGLRSIDVPANLGITWYNHAADHPTADPAVRKALTQAVNLDELATAITGGAGGRATALAVLPPTTCSFDSVTGNLPASDVAAAAATLEQAGYAKGADGKYAKDGKPLTISFLYDSALGTTGQAAAELAAQQWNSAGFTIEMSSLDTARLSEVLFGTGAWDVAWEPVNVNSPDQIVSMLSGPSVADGGSNFSSIVDADYDAAVTAALALTGEEACGAFQTAEGIAFKNSNVVAWAVRPTQIFLNGVQFSYIGKTEVTSLRMLAG